MDQRPNSIIETQRSLGQSTVDTARSQIGNAMLHDGLSTSTPGPIFCCPIFYVLQTFRREGEACTFCQGYTSGKALPKVVYNHLELQWFYITSLIRHYIDGSTKAPPHTALAKLWQAYEQACGLVCRLGWLL
jgi:hypothetical protein